MAVRKGKRNKFSFVWTKELIFLILGIIAMIVAVIIMIQPSAKEKFYDTWSAKLSDSDTALATDHIYSKISLSDLGKKVKNSDEYIYVFYGTEQDSTCVSNIELFNATAQSFKITKIYYLNADFVYDEENKTTRSFQLEIDEKEAKVNSQCDFFNYPSLWVFHNGDLVFTSDKYRDEDDTLQVSWSTVAYSWAYTGYEE